jgi:hypothetical protein
VLVFISAISEDWNFTARFGIYQSIWNGTLNAISSINALPGVKIRFSVVMIG